MSDRTKFKLANHFLLGEIKQRKWKIVSKSNVIDTRRGKRELDERDTAIIDAWNALNMIALPAATRKDHIDSAITLGALLQKIGAWDRLNAPSKGGKGSGISSKNRKQAARKIVDEIFDAALDRCMRAEILRDVLRSHPRIVALWPKAKGRIVLERGSDPVPVIDDDALDDVLKIDPPIVLRDSIKSRWGKR